MKPQRRRPGKKRGAWRSVLELAPDKAPEGNQLCWVVLHGNGKLVDWKLQLLQPPQ